jgi:hypothetical protein
MSGPLNYTTVVSADKSAAECLEVLRKYGAKRAGLAYGSDKIAMGISFVLDTRWGPRGYEIAVNAAGTYRALERAVKNRDIDRRFATPAQGQRVAWRVVKMWLESNLALVESGLQETEKVFFPYMLLAPDHTLFEEYDQQQPSIESGART